MKNTLFALLMMFGTASFGQVVINELDTDTPSTDDREFIELRSDSPNFPLDGYLLVFFNGSATSSTSNLSYYTIDLDGYSTDINGLILIGNNLVSPVPEKYFPISVMQNGADGVAIYQANPSDFPDGTMANTQNLVDALVYGTSDPDATSLMELLGESAQIDENLNSLGTSQSIQRKVDGTYEVKLPTPGAHNDGSGIAFNGLTISGPLAVYNEGESFSITFTTQFAVASDLNFTFAMNNSSFNPADYSTSLSVFIPAGSTSATVPVLLVDDSNDDGDELAVIRFGTLPVGYNRLNDNVEVRVIDNDFTTSAWGTPLSPTYGNVQGDIPAGYYDSLEGLSGNALKMALQNIIANPDVVRAHTYGDVEIILKRADQNPLNSNQVWMMYVESPLQKYQFQTSSSNVGTWNREHIFPQSRGGFANGTEDTPDGIDVFLPTNADDIMAGHSDAHHIRAEDGPENSIRSNRDYGLDYNGPVGNQGSWKGDVARSLFYMAVRYNALSLVNGNPPDTTLGQIGDLASLLAWNTIDPADDFEQNRNNVVYQWQYNRNPFIDYPALADYIFGASVNQPWDSSLSVADAEIRKVQLYPNPAKDVVFISGIDQGTLVEIFNPEGSKVSVETYAENGLLLSLPAGVYFARITNGEMTVTKKLIIR